MAPMPMPERRPCQVCRRLTHQMLRSVDGQMHHVCCARCLGRLARVLAGDR